VTGNKNKAVIIQLIQKMKNKVIHEHVVKSMNKRRIKVVNLHMNRKKKTAVIMQEIKNKVTKVINCSTDEQQKERK